MAIIVDIKPILKTDNILEVLSGSTYMPTEERLKKRADDYINNSNVVVYGYKCEGTICGLIVLDITKKEEIVILDIAVGKGNQQSGIGRKLVEYALYNLKPNTMIAETDDDSVNFYRKCGFIIYNLGEKYPNIIRYKCKYFSQHNEGNHL